MYAWIDAEEWAADGQPSITEEHGLLRDLDSPRGAQGRGKVYGRILSDDDELMVVHALLQRRLELIEDQEQPLF